MRTDDKIDGKVVFKCDSCGIKEVGGSLLDWTKEGTYQSQTKPEKPLYFCPKCSEERK